MAITLEFNNIYEECYQRLLDTLPLGTDNLKEGVVAPSHTVDSPIPFKLNNLTPNIVYLVTIYSKLYKAPKTQFGFVPTREEYILSVPLALGENTIYLAGADGTQAAFTVSITNYGTYFYAYAQEITEYSLWPIQEVENNIYSSVAYILASPLIGDLSRLVPTDLEILATLSNKLFVKNLTNSPGTDSSTRELLAGFSASNPIFFPMKNLGVAETPLYRSEEDFSGYEAHTWLPNREIERYFAFITLMGNLPQLFSLKQISEGEVYLTKGGTLTRHIFDFESSFANSIIEGATLLSECFNNLFKIDVTVNTEHFISFCQATYTFDTLIPFPGLSASDSDPLAITNWTEFSLAGRFEQQWDISKIHNWVYDSPVLGTVDGINRYFNLTQDPASIRAVKIFIDGLLIKFGVDYRFSIGSEFRSGFYDLTNVTSPILADITIGVDRPFIAPVFFSLEVSGGANVQYFITAASQDLQNINFVISNPPALSGPEESKLHYITPALPASGYAGLNQYATDALTSGLYIYNLVYPTPAVDIDYQLFVQYAEDPMTGDDPTQVKQLQPIVKAHTLTGAVIEFSEDIDAAGAKLHWWLIEEDGVALERGTLPLSDEMDDITITFTGGPYFDPIVCIFQLWNTSGLVDVAIPFYSFTNLTPTTVKVQFSDTIEGSDYRLDYAIFSNQAGNVIEIFNPPQVPQLIEAHYDTEYVHWAHEAPIESADGLRQIFTLNIPCPIREAMYLTLNGRLLTNKQYVVSNSNEIRLGFAPEANQYLWAVYPTINPITFQEPGSSWSQDFLTRQNSLPSTNAAGKIFNAGVIAPNDLVTLSGISLIGKETAKGNFLNLTVINSGDAVIFTELSTTLVAVPYITPYPTQEQFKVGVDQDTDALQLVNKINTHPTLSIYYSAKYLRSGTSEIRAKYLTGTLSNQTIGIVGFSLLATNITGDSSPIIYPFGIQNFASGVTRDLDSRSLANSINSHIQLKNRYYATYISEGAISITANNYGEEWNEVITVGSSMTKQNISGGSSTKYDLPMFTPKVAYTRDAPVIVLDGASTRWYNMYSGNSIKFDSPAAAVQEPYFISEVFPVDSHPLDSMAANQPCNYPKGLFTQGLFNNLLETGTTTEICIETVGDTTLDSSVLTNLSSIGGIKINNIIKGNGIPDNTFVKEITGIDSLNMYTSKHQEFEVPTLAPYSFTLSDVPIIWANVFDITTSTHSMLTVVSSAPGDEEVNVNLTSSVLTFSSSQAGAFISVNYFTDQKATSTNISTSLSFCSAHTMIVVLNNLPIQEEPSGVIDGSNVLFDIDLISCNGQNSLLIWLDGIFQPPDKWLYSEIGGHGRITFLSPPLAGKLWCWYLPAGDGCANENVVALTGFIDGINQDFGVPNSPFVNSPCLITFLEGLFQLQEYDYTVNPGNTTITFLSSKTPAFGQSLWSHFNTGAIGEEKWRQVTLGYGDGVTLSFNIPYFVTNELPTSQDSVILAVNGRVYREKEDFEVILDTYNFPTGEIIFTVAPESTQKIDVAYIRRG